MSWFSLLLRNNQIRIFFRIKLPNKIHQLVQFVFILQIHTKFRKLHSQNSKHPVHQNTFSPHNTPYKYALIPSGPQNSLQIDSVITPILLDNPESPTQAKVNFAAAPQLSSGESIESTIAKQDQLIAAASTFSDDEIHVEEVPF